MENIVLQLTHPQVDEAALFRTLHMEAETEENAEDVAAVRRMLTEALAVARPKAVYRLALVTERGSDYVLADGVRLTSALVSRNLEHTRRIVPYVATCGVEAEQWSAAYDSDPLEQFWADTIKLMLLTAVRTEMLQAIRRDYFPQRDLSNMRPGSISAWPLSQQEALFRMMGDVAGTVGVTLTASSLMLPSKSISGFYFSAEEHFETCRYCPLLHCPSRQEAYRGPAD